jgi:hypothetical protein
LAAYVIVHVAKRGERSSARSGRQALTSATVRRILAEHEGVLLPEDGATDPDASVVVTISVPDMKRAEALAKALSDLDEVDTAYAKPGEELP